MKGSAMFTMVPSSTTMKAYTEMSTRGPGPGAASCRSSCPPCSPRRSSGVPERSLGGSSGTVCRLAGGGQQDDLVDHAGDRVGEWAARRGDEHAVQDDAGQRAGSKQGQVGVAARLRAAGRAPRSAGRPPPWARTSSVRNASAGESASRAIAVMTLLAKVATVSGEAQAAHAADHAPSGRRAAPVSGHVRRSLAVVQCVDDEAQLVGPPPVERRLEAWPARRRRPWSTGRSRRRRRPPVAARSPFRGRPRCGPLGEGYGRFLWVSEVGPEPFTMKQNCFVSSRTIARDVISRFPPTFSFRCSRTALRMVEGQVPASIGRTPDRGSHCRRAGLLML